MTIFDHLTGILASIEAIPGKIATAMSSDVQAIHAKLDAQAAQIAALASQIEALIGKPDDKPAPAAQDVTPAQAASPVPPAAPTSGA